MAMIYVKTKQGRKAFYEGRIIPSDQFIPVTDDPYIQRLIHHWEDLEVQGASAPAAAAAPAPVSPPRPKPPTPVATPAPAQASLPLAPGTGAPKPN